MVLTRAAVRRLTPSVLLSIPPELLLLIADHLPYRDLTVLLRTNSYIKALLAPFLYRRTVRDGSSSMFLNWCAAAGFPRVFGALLAAGAAVDGTNAPWNRTPLLAAVLGYQDPSMLARESDFEFPISGQEYVPAPPPAGRSRRGKRPVRTAEEWLAGREEIIWRLLAAPDGAVNDKATDTIGQTALHLASQASAPVSKAIIDTLLARGAGLEARNDLGYTPLLWAAVKGNAVLARYLGEAGADATVVPQWPGPGVNLNSHRAHTALHMAAEYADLPLCLALLEAARNVKETLEAPDSLDRTPLFIAAWRGSYQVAQVLLEHGASVRAADELDRTPLHVAVSGEDICVPFRSRPRNRFALIRALLEHGADINEPAGDTGRTPLHFAAPARCSLGIWREYQPRIVALLLDRGAAVNARAANGATPLHAAAESVAAEANIRELLDAGADVHATTTLTAKTPLHYACAAPADNPANVRVLLAAGAHVDATDHAHGTPLAWAAHSGHVLACRALIAAGADVDAADAKARTPLHLAAKMGHVDVVRVLCEASCDLWAEDAKGRQALQIASPLAGIIIDQAMEDREEEEEAMREGEEGQDQEEVLVTMMALAAAAGASSATMLQLLTIYYGH